MSLKSQVKRESRYYKFDNAALYAKIIIKKIKVCVTYIIVFI